MRLGLGTWGIGGIDYGPISKHKSYLLLKFSIENNIRFFDTAPLYGNGRSEKIIGEVIKNIKRSSVKIATKCGMLPHIGFKHKQNFSTKFLKQDLYGSLERLNTNYIDYYLLHSPNLKKINFKQIILFANSLKKKKLIKSFGVSLNSPSDIFHLSKFYKNIDIVELNFNLLDQRAYFEGVLSLCKKKGIKTICRTPLAFGFLTDKKIIKQKLHNKDHRRNWSNKQFQRWEYYKKSFNNIRFKYSQKLSDFAILFCLSHNFNYIIPGMLKKKEILQNLSLKNKRIKKKDLDIVRKIYINIEDKIFVQKRSR